MHLKTCSKCKNDLPITKFVRSLNYIDGHYPLCKDCRKASRLRHLATYPLCRNCKQESHVKGQPYCYRCWRLMQGRSLDVKFRRDTSNKLLCSRCKEQPRLQYHNYCQECKNSNWRKWDNEFGGWKNMSTEQRQKAVARRYVKTKIDRGHMKRLPCQVCGNSKTEAHHHKGYDKEHALDVVFLCKRHHDERERVEKSRLTKQPLLL